MNIQTEKIFLHARHDAPNELALRYKTVRAQSIALAKPLSEEDCCVQSMPDASPIKWHLAHSTWFFETFILERFEPDFRPHHPAFRVLFNSYYNGVGDKHARAQRGLLTRPSLSEVLDYRRDVDARMMSLMSHSAEMVELNKLVELGLQHEQQHQELMMTDVLHLLSCNPLKPAYTVSSSPLARPAAELQWLSFKGGVVHIGYDASGFCFDNELPVHRQFLEPYTLASRLVSNREYLEFVESGAYQNPAVWLSEAWDWVQAQQLAHPLYWQKNADAWQVFSLHGLQDLNPDAVLTQISYFEADAYARWSGARLPTETEWENAVVELQSSTGKATDGMQFFGNCWQWTSSSYSPYPGYETAAGALGEYNGKFMCNQYVLRGSSCVTPDSHSRASYRNFFPATARWQFSGIRLAR
jgi:ergothioneine biosynthesis protein EgtB